MKLDIIKEANRTQANAERTYDDTINQIDKLINKAADAWIRAYDVSQEETADQLADDINYLISRIR